MGIAENLRRFREGAGLSQDQLADEARVSQQLISQIERGENLTTKKLPQIAHALGKPVFELDPNFSPADVPEDQAAAELLAIYGRLASKPHARAHLLEQARALESLVLGQGAPSEPKAADGQ